MKKFILSLSFIFIISLVVGCAPKDRRCVVSGTITSDGQPLPTGVVNFSPIDPDPTKSVVGASADIVNGQYAISPETGLLAGKYKVTVTASRCGIRRPANLSIRTTSKTARSSRPNAKTSTLFRLSLGAIRKSFWKSATKRP
ncbi:MAG: carboxypeptidase regulatory-like domain-containing protein [Thermoguttaceae bacterium]|nr:carboxypeptidase regulatory-like domain-containing protein [Thermoguttaceae bacterium]